MPFGFVHRTTSATALKAGLDASSARLRGIASRVAQASLVGDGFALPGTAQEAGTDQVDPAALVDTEAEMAALANEQLHYEATAKLLEKTYQQLRASLRTG